MVKSASVYNHILREALIIRKKANSCIIQSLCPWMCHTIIDFVTFSSTER
jgi:hypothetical protein